jgi:SPP1 family predicted phage head-tail adaptor
MKYRIEAGKYRHVVDIQQRQFGGNEYGETTQDWTTIYTTKAGINPVSGNEFYRVQEVNAEITHKVYLRYLPNITPDMRILFNGRQLMITSIVNYQERNLELKLMCKELYPNGVSN